MTKIRYGISSEIEQTFPTGYTVSQLLNDHSVLGQLNAPEGCVALSMGEVLSPSEEISNYSLIYLEKRASSKAA